MNVQLLDPSSHKRLRISLRPTSDSFGNKGFAELVTTEFVSAASQHPLFFTKSEETGRFIVGMLHHLENWEGETGPDAPSEAGYLPFSVQRAGFYIVGEHLGVDLAHPGLSLTEGRRLFGDDGQATDDLKAIQRAVSGLKRGRAETDAFIDALLRHRLLEPIDISLRFDDGERLSLAGLYTVSLDAVRDLPDDSAIQLFRTGYLQLAYCMAGSLAQLTLLAQRRNARSLTGAPA